MIPVTMWCKGSVCSHMTAGITGLNRAEDKNVCLVFVVCVMSPVMGRLLVQSPTGCVPACVHVCVCVISKSK